MCVYTTKKRTCLTDGGHGPIREKKRGERERSDQADVRREERKEGRFKNQLSSAHAGSGYERSQVD